MTEVADKAVEGQVVDGSRQLATEIKAQRELAISNPRNELAIFDKAIKELEIAPEFAEEAYYSIPYKDNEAEGGKTFVEGLSVKASRAVDRYWSNCATASRIVSEDGDAVTVEGIFADFETNVFFRRTVRVPKNYIPRKTGIPTPLRADRLNMAIQAGMSKAERNASLSGKPEWLKERYFAKAKQIAGQKGKKEGKTDAQRVQAMIEGFAKLGVEKARIEAYMADKFAKDANIDDTLGTMRGVFNAIKDGQVKADDVFTPLPASKAGVGAVSGSDLGGK